MLGLAGQATGGGMPGQTGRNAVVRRDGSVEELAGCAEVAMQPGDRFIIETPGGGGYGPPTGSKS